METVDILRIFIIVTGGIGAITWLGAGMGYKSRWAIVAGLFLSEGTMMAFLGWNEWVMAARFCASIPFQMLELRRSRLRLAESKAEVKKAEVELKKAEVEFRRSRLELLEDENKTMDV